MCSPTLTVHQNLMLGQKGNSKNSRWSFDDMYQMFPRLKERQHTEAGRDVRGRAADAHPVPDPDGRP
jgi:ABC-type branched-subunit amino acid transport system ATPase component